MTETDTVTYRGHPTMFADHPLTFLLALLLVPVFGIGLVILIVWWIKARSTVLTVTPGHAILEQGLFSKRRIELDVDSVRTVEIDQTFVDRIFGCGAVKIFTAGDEPEIELKGMPHPAQLRQALRH